jgi:hypothetical protein
VIETRVFEMIEKLFTVLPITAAAMIASPGSAAAIPPTDCNPVVNPSVVYSPCWQSYINGKEWEMKGVVAIAQQTGSRPQAMTADQMAAVCREGLQEQSPSDTEAFANGCAEVMAAWKAQP